MYNTPLNRAVWKWEYKGMGIVRRRINIRMGISNKSGNGNEREWEQLHRHGRDWEHQKPFAIIVSCLRQFTVYATAFVR